MGPKCETDDRPLIGSQMILKRGKKSIAGRVENCFLTMLVDNRAIVRWFISRGFNCQSSTSVYNMCNTYI